VRTVKVDDKSLQWITWQAMPSYKLRMILTLFRGISFSASLSSTWCFCRSCRRLWSQWIWCTLVMPLKGLFQYDAQCCYLVNVGPTSSETCLFISQRVIYCCFQSL